MNSDIEQIRRTLDQTRSILMNKPNVIATGIGYKIVSGRRTDNMCIVCSVEIKMSKEKLGKQELIPPDIQGASTDVIPTGPLVARQDPTERFRPAPGGVSIGHVNVTAGTLGCLVKKNGAIYILSNNHVLANSNEASAGDPILQPGSHDGGQQPQDQIAQLNSFVPIVFEGNGGVPPCPTAGVIASVLNAMASALGSYSRLRPYRVAASENKVDCAIAKPIKPEDVTNEILNIGSLSGVGEGKLGMEIKKSGRTTGLTTGTIQQVDVTARVNYGANKVAIFTDQLMAGGMSQGGDSGSAVLDNDNNIVGLLFAGSDTTTLINRIDNVFEALGVTLP